MKKELPMSGLCGCLILFGSCAFLVTIRNLSIFVVAHELPIQCCFNLSSSQHNSKVVEHVDKQNPTEDYYAQTHRVKETVTEQPKMLVGGKLKPYQVNLLVR